MYKLSVRQGAKYDKPESRSAIRPFIELHSLDVDEIATPIDEFKTFNDFFARALKPSSRPIAAPGDETVLLSPAGTSPRLSQYVGRSR